MPRSPSSPEPATDAATDGRPKRSRRPEDPLCQTDSPSDDASTGQGLEAGASLSLVRLPAEVRDRDELDRLAEADTCPRPEGWRLSPRMVQKYILGDPELRIEPKFVGDRDVVQLAIASLASDRALLLTGLPGTAKSWLSEHLSAAISGTSQLVIQGTAGVTEDQVKYTWNYALLLADGPTDQALVPAPILTGIRQGLLVRFEEVTRCAPEVQDALISVLSEKAIAIPELQRVESARRGFNVIATANTRDRGVNEMSAALRRRFSFVTLPVLSDLTSETALVERRVEEMLRDFRIEAELPLDAVATLVQVFAELRSGHTLDGSARVRSPDGPMSTAEAISSLFSSCLMAAHFGDGQITGRDLLRGLSGSVVQEGDRAVLEEYLETIVRGREGRYWQEIYAARPSAESKSG